MKRQYAVTVTMYVTGSGYEEETEQSALDKVYDVLDVAYSGIDSYSVDNVEAIEDNDNYNEDDIMEE